MAGSFVRRCAEVVGTVEVGFGCWGVEVGGWGGACVWCRSWRVVCVRGGVRVAWEV